MKKLFLILLSSVLLSFSSSQPTIKIARLKYNGGGDWYCSPTSLNNLIAYCNKNLNTNISPQEDVVEVGSQEIFNYPLIHLTGHGNVTFSPAEAANLRSYLLGGGFLNINDSYGMDMFIRNELKKVFPELTLAEIPYNHPVYHQKYNFPNGIPKIHEHDKKPAQLFGLVYNGRLICLYNYQTDIGDGWEDFEVHKDPEEKRQEALKFGANIIQFVFNQN
ncbi:MAG: DUF4159 domain-containing protein [Bacteroidetes bacterium]|nr:DUF4159 domain-containing protein [Bacteroidota bacterium]